MNRFFKICLLDSYRMSNSHIAGICILIYLVMACGLWNLSEAAQLISTNSSECVDDTCRLVEIQSKDVTPTGRRVFRPDVVSIGSVLYLTHNDGTGWANRELKLLSLDENLEPIGSVVNLFSEGGAPTDIRVSSDGNHLWYAFETVTGRQPGCSNHFVNAAVYDVSKHPKLISGETRLSTGCTGGMSRFRIDPQTIPINPVYADDPTPFYHKGKYYILTRAWAGAVQHVRAYDNNLNELESFTVDLEPVIGERKISQNALVDIDNQIYLIAGVMNGPPISENAISNTYAIPLSHDLKQTDGDMVPLVIENNEFNNQATSARYHDGKLYINYVDAWGGVVGARRNAAEYLIVFDVKDDFNQIEKIKIQQETSTSNHPGYHSTLDLLNGKVYFFYGGDNKSILAKVFEWQ